MRIGTTRRLLLALVPCVLSGCIDPFDLDPFERRWDGTCDMVDDSGEVDVQLALTWVNVERSGEDLGEEAGKWTGFTATLRIEETGVESIEISGLEILRCDGPCATREDGELIFDRAGAEFVAVGAPSVGRSYWLTLEALVDGDGYQGTCRLRRQDQVDETSSVYTGTLTMW